MELRAFAERVLFATTLEEKLQCPRGITDDSPGTPFRTPAAPGRPAHLCFKPHGSGRADFPGVHRIEQERDRGLLLHFFANHELLATELMALVLLKFPDAPQSFRRGVLQTLKDEQRHTRLYLNRMKDCGIEFGEIPVNGYFWRAVSGMDSPMDYVAGLSLTFEQANLDFCRSFAQGFKSVGDDDTARLLDGIYRDEIGHVAYGLKWFRRWKHPQQSDWEAFCGQLKFPLSPSRAKGTSLNVEGRRAAGLDRGFIDELNVYSQSKGRTPGVFVFNPFAELRVGQGKRFTPIKDQALLARDLENLPQFLCRQDDIVLVQNRPSVEFLSSLKQAGFMLPEFVELNRGREVAAKSLAQRKINCLRPWAWGPDSAELFDSLSPNLTDEATLPSRRFNSAIGRLYSKKWSADFLRTFLSGPPGESWLCSESDVGVAVGTVKDVLRQIHEIRRRGHHKVVLKQNYGLAGQNMIRLWEPGVSRAQTRWIERVIGNGGLVVVEPWLERVMDFSVQLEVLSEGVKFLGYTGLLNDRRGQFEANWAESTRLRRVPGRLPVPFQTQVRSPDNLHSVFRAITKALANELVAAGYLGPVGIDAFVYQTTAGEFRLKPVVEINCRYTLGRLTLELMKHVYPGCSGLFRLINRSKAKAQGFDEFASYAAALVAREPVRLEGSPKARIRTGSICLNDPSKAQRYLALFQVDRSLDRR